MRYIYRFLNSKEKMDSLGALLFRLSTEARYWMLIKYVDFSVMLNDILRGFSFNLEDKYNKCSHKRK